MFTKRVVICVGLVVIGLFVSLVGCASSPPVDPIEWRKISNQEVPWGWHVVVRRELEDDPNNPRGPVYEMEVRTPIFYISSVLVKGETIGNSWLETRENMLLRWQDSFRYLKGGAWHIKTSYYKNPEDCPTIPLETARYFKIENRSVYCFTVDAGNQRSEYFFGVPGSGGFPYYSLYELVFWRRTEGGKVIEQKFFCLKSTIPCFALLDSDVDVGAPYEHLYGYYNVGGRTVPENREFWRHSSSRSSIRLD